ncbi:Pleckstrin homology domain-containing family G member 1,Pleckstrin homology domain-containing family G member 3 [Mytilus coruscus]|uniref:Pleckstrin homology domain-containing family G member 1,Pleckstrin homology domain-containing family G member 3 n=1 Tax=Mytilus coruscus TaxID=42192 RepID=A0A6J8D4F4_MYTCO|nr:Pleckstrin homology domain-containing family G member 1,Pleckstrin homology domain-containing family G member 3 [Mytilus coruscus]
MKGTMDYKLLQYKKDLIDISSGESNEDSDQCPEEFMDNGQCPQKLLDSEQCQEEREQKEIIRNSMHWDEFFGSSLELAPALLSIYDSIAARTNGGITCSITNGNNKNKKIATDNQSSPVDVDDNDESVDNLCKMASTSSIVSVDQDCKKRPLSISSMSSSSSSSLTRHTRKRPNLSPFDQRSSGDFESTNNNFSDRLDHLLYIDDDVPSGTTDEEMSIDTDAGSKSSAETNCEQILTPSQSKDSLITPSRSAQSQETPETSVQIQDNTEPSIQRRDSTSPQKYVSYVQRVVTEIIETERIYINNLKDILEGYMGFIRNSPELKISEDHISALFGNIEEIYDFGKDFLHDLETCGDDPVKVAECFVKNNDGFRIYAQYCTNYPSAVEVLTMIMKDPDLFYHWEHIYLNLSKEFSNTISKPCSLNHLGTYLLKPVQRVFKYHLLLQNILKNYSKSEPGHDTLTKAMDHMTSMAHHINEMKRKHEHAVRVQEIQSQLEDYDGEDLTRLGELVLEGSFRIYGAKTSRQVFLFERGVLIGKRKEDGMLICRVMIQCSNLMLVESIPKEPLSFQVIPFDNPKGYITLQARNLDQKRKWCQEIKRLIIESFKGKIPEKVKGLVMQLGKSREEEAAKYSTVDSRRISHHTAPEYLERRQRMRRKSGTILTDLLKPQRGKKGQRRAESVSPRSSPPPERKGLSHSPSTPSTREVLNSSNIDTPTLYVPPSVSPTKVGRSISFRQAVKRQPLRSVDFGPLDDKENTSKVKQETPTSSRRSKSFKRATKLKPLLSVSNDTLESIAPNSHEQDVFYTPSKKSAGLEFSFSSPSTPSENSSSPKTFRKFMRSETEKLCNDNSGSLSRHIRYSSMPVLNTLEPPSPLLRKHRKCSEEITSQENSSLVKKRIFDTKLYFKRDSPDLRRKNNSVLAFHDSFTKKSTENLSRKSTEHLSQKVGPITLTKPRPFISSSFDTKPKKTEH